LTSARAHQLLQLLKPNRSDALVGGKPLNLDQALIDALTNRAQVRERLEPLGGLEIVCIVDGFLGA